MIIDLFDVPKNVVVCHSQECTACAGQNNDDFALHFHAVLIGSTVLDTKVSSDRGGGDLPAPRAYYIVGARFTFLLPSLLMTVYKSGLATRPAN